MQFTDIHWHNGETLDRETQNLMTMALDHINPDLVTLTGDILSGSNCKDPRESLRQVVAVDVMGTYVGHDHINDYEGDLYGIRLCYCRGTGFHTYGREGFPRGARIIQLMEGKRDFRTWQYLADGSTLLRYPEHAPAGRVLSTLLSL